MLHIRVTHSSISHWIFFWNEYQ